MKDRIKRIRPPAILLLILVCSSMLVPVIAVTRGYDARTLTEYSVGFVVLLAAAVVAWMLDRRPPRLDGAERTDRAISAGLVIGLLWVVEIGINNFIAPPLSARDHVDNAFWAVIALSILCIAIQSAYQADRWRAGVSAGVWSGFVSGAVACCMALSLIAFGMRAILADPLNRAEWAARGPQSGAPSMASYFAAETFAGALGHLIVLGIVMGALLGVLGGVVGKGIRRMRPTPRASQ